jgi:hypothetical protein
LLARGKANSLSPVAIRCSAKRGKKLAHRRSSRRQGVIIRPEALQVVTVETTPDRQQNLLFCQSPPAEHDGSFVHDTEVSEVLVIYEPVETAFPLHTRVVRQFFATSAPI